MQYKREESFRYEFPKPLEATFKLIRVETSYVESKEGKMDILDISGGGLKMSSSLELPDPNKKEIHLEFDLQLAEHTMETQGVIVWKKALGQSFQYGIDFTHTDKESQALITLLKNHIKQQSSELDGRS
ncbi:PilZ domain-containing protein [Bacillus sp. FJAT-45037]|uniref:PilZ domain-containing protein n=1 Tax=Bacillus sp. FJAT-45037 TaxID=2011007 RepID=UPI000C2412E0|nr:PilZ domain-containing protein [Bacillus sp. FJAT-45037]